MDFDSHETDLFLIVKRKKLKSMEKIWIAKNYEINIAKKLPFCNEKSILPKYCHFHKIYAQNLPWIRQIFAKFSVKHLATLSLPVFRSDSSKHRLFVSVSFWTCSFGDCKFAWLCYFPISLSRRSVILWFEKKQTFAKVLSICNFTWNVAAELW